MRAEVKVFLGTFFFFILIPLLAQFFIGINLNIPNSNKGLFRNENSKYCPSQACRNESLRLWENGNRSADPCNDFYNYVCGNFEYTAKTAGVDTFSHLSKLQVQIDETLTKDLVKPHWSDKTSTRLIKAFYEKCSSDESMAAYEEILKFIKVTLGGWPLLENGKTKYNVANKFYNVVKRLKSNNLDIKLPFEYTVDKTNKSHQPLHIWPVKTLINLQLIYESDFKSIFNNLVNTAVLLGGNYKIIKSDIEAMIGIESFFREVHTGDHSQGVFNSTETLSHEIPGIDWRTLFQILLEQKEPKYDFDSIIVHDIERVKTIAFLMVAQIRTFTNYLVWNAFAPWQELLMNMKLRAERLAGLITLDKEKWDRKENCLKMLRTTIALNGYYTRKYLMENWKVEAEDMLHLIKDEAEKHLKMTAWKDETAVVAMRNLENLGAIIAYPDFLMDEVKLEKYYNVTVYEKKTAFEIYIEIMKAEKNIFLDIRKDTKNNIESMRDFMVANIEAAYDRGFHKLMIPGGVLHSPYYMSDRPMYLNFGGIGFMMGHEMVHAFRTLEDTKVSCLKNQFSDYVLSQINERVNGIKTVRENYADNVGVQLAYKAFKVWKAKQKKDELPLPHFRTHTPEQMFWINAASLWCTYESDENLKEFILYEEHTPSEARINAGFSNFIDFAVDFNCPQDSKMNPRHKCA